MSDQDISTQMAVEPFCLGSPTQQRLPFVFSSPHSGRHYPADFLNSSRLDNLKIRQSEDFLIDDLFSSVVRQGAPLLSANYPRAYVDVNREPYELDPRMFEGKLPDYVNTNSIRVAGGLGTIARIVSEDHYIYKAKLGVGEGLARIEDIYKPYHRTLRSLIGETLRSFGFCVLVDCHSMPSTSVEGSGSSQTDFVLGDRYGTAASKQLVEKAVSELRSLGYAVSINKPYAGGFITEHYGRPLDGLHTFQLEINRGLYMDEKNMVPSSNYSNLKRDLEIFVHNLTSIPDAGLMPENQIAAE